MKMLAQRHSQPTKRSDRSPRRRASHSQSYPKYRSPKSCLSPEPQPESDADQEGIVQPGDLFLFADIWAALAELVI